MCGTGREAKSGTGTGKKFKSVCDLVYGSNDLFR